VGTPSIDALSQPVDRRIQLNATVRQSTMNKLNVLVEAVQERNPGRKRSQVVDTLISDALDTLQIKA